MQSTTIVAGIGAIVLAFPGCGGDATPAPRAPSSVSAAQETRAGSRSPTQSTVHIAEDIRKACGLAASDAHFPFDSATVLESERRVLKQLADCFVSGPLAGRAMRVVGHTDPRGDTDYNFVLGGRRADNVKGVLVKQGLPPERVASTSRGELEADGVDEASWREDRRVDVTLAQ